jgi:hypothetical protein
MKRYTIENDWQTVRHECVDESYDGELVMLTVEVATLLSLRDGHRYEGGARRYTLQMGRTRRTKTFTGEFAYDKGASWVRDTAWDLARQAVTA